MRCVARDPRGHWPRLATAAVASRGRPGTWPIFSSHQPGRWANVPAARSWSGAAPLPALSCASLRRWRPRRARGCTVHTAHARRAQTSPRQRKRTAPLLNAAPLRLQGSPAALAPSRVRDVRDGRHMGLAVPPEPVAAKRGAHKWPYRSARIAARPTTRPTTRARRTGQPCTVLIRTLPGARSRTQRPLFAASVGAGGPSAHMCAIGAPPGAPGQGVCVSSHARCYTQ